MSSIKSRIQKIVHSFFHDILRVGDIKATIVYNKIINDKNISELFSKEVDYIRQTKRVGYFTYPFCEKYNDKMNLQIGYDLSNKLCYAVHGGRKLYMKRGYNKKQTRKYFIGLLMEQDMQSPHLYLTKELLEKRYGTVVDVGAAEGIFAADILPLVNKIILIESDPDWIEALKCSFADVSSKVEIIQGKVSNNDNEEHNFATLDTILKPYSDVDLVKMDIEGYELNAIHGMKNVLENNSMTLLLCAYHNASDEAEIREAFASDVVKTRNGYMLVHSAYPKLKAPYFRRGVLEIQHDCSKLVK